MFFKPLEKLKSPFWSCYCVFGDVLTTVKKDTSSYGLEWNVFNEIPGPKGQDSWDLLGRSMLWHENSAHEVS